METSEQISVFDIFKIGVGPSSSHTLGPWKAAKAFVDSIVSQGKLKDIHRVQVLLYGSLAKTGAGHGTDIAVLMGLIGADPITFPVDQIKPTVEMIREERLIHLSGQHLIKFDYHTDLIWLFKETLPFHPNAVVFQALFNNGTAESKTYYSIGGGFVVQQPEKERVLSGRMLPYPIESAAELQGYCNKLKKKISAVVFENEKALRQETAVESGVKEIFKIMQDCVYRGCHTSGNLPGGLNVKRRAAAINRSLIKCNYHDYESWVEAVRSTGSDFDNIVDWVSCFALAVNEENASFGRVVTAPTNGAAGVIPAVLHYFIIFCNGYCEDKIRNFLLTASEIGSIFKKGATLSAAMGGCQAEIGVSSAMAAAALTECLGGTVAQTLMAAEIAMEHHLGLTCDPIAGLVQVPCIERNAIGAIKAITAAQLALKSDPANAKVSLDDVVKTMWYTALDMNIKYKETADGGLAVNVPISLSEC